MYPHTHTLTHVGLHSTTADSWRGKERRNERCGWPTGWAGGGALVSVFFPRPQISLRPEAVTTLVSHARGGGDAVARKKSKEKESMHLRFVQMQSILGGSFSFFFLAVAWLRTRGSLVPRDGFRLS